MMDKLHLMWMRTFGTVSVGSFSGTIYCGRGGISVAGKMYD